MFFHLLLQIFLVSLLTFMPDGGGRYAETNLDNTIVEPWNAVSSLFLIVPSIYLIIKLRGTYRQHPFLLFCIPLLILGGLGSTLYHAFRVFPFFLYMDVLPTLVLTLAVSAYFWYRVINNAWWVALIILGTFVLRFGLSYIFPRPLSINLSYLISGIVIFLPTLLLLIATKFRQSQLIILAALLLGVSLVFRRLDSELTDLLPMGTHFLWHIFSAAGSLFLAEYLYYIDRRRVSLIGN